MSRIKDLFGGLLRTKKRPPSNEQAAAEMNISGPTNVKHEYHVGFDRTAGEFTNLPPSWQPWLEALKLR